MGDGFLAKSGKIRKKGFFKKDNNEKRINDFLISFEKQNDFFEEARKEDW